MLASLQQWNPNIPLNIPMLRKAAGSRSKVVWNQEKELISREAYENGGSWIVNRWVYPGDRVGRGENSVCAVYQSRANDIQETCNNVETGSKRKRSGPSSSSSTCSSTLNMRTPPSCMRRMPRRVLTGGRRLSRVQNNLPGSVQYLAGKAARIVLMVVCQVKCLCLS